MQITRAVEYAAMGLMSLARRPFGTTAMLEELSQEEAIPASFLGKIFQSLAKAGMVRSARGTGGGFMLVRPAEQITLLEVFEAVEGPLALQRCQLPTPACERSDSCALCGVFEQAQDKVKDVFSQTTIHDLALRHQPANPRTVTPAAPASYSTSTPSTLDPAL